MFLDKDLSKLRDDFLEFQPSNMDDVSRDRLEFFLWELNFLDSFLSLQSFTFSGECGMLDITQKMKHIWKKSISVQQANLQILFSGSDCEGSVNPNFDPFTSHVPTEIWNTKLEFRAKYSFPEMSIPVSSNKDDVPTSKFVMEFINAVAENLNILLQIDDPLSLLYVPETKEQIEEVLKEFNLLKIFVSIASNKCIDPQTQHTFFTHVLHVVGHAAMVAWLYLPIHGNEIMQRNYLRTPQKFYDLANTEMNVLLSDLLQMKIKPIQPDIRKIYIDVLQTLKATIQPGWKPNVRNNHVADSGFQDMLPSVSNPSLIVSLSDQMAIFRDMLSLLRAKLIHLPILDPKFHIQDMDIVIVDAGLLIYSLYDIKEEKEYAMLEDVNVALDLDLPRSIQPINAMIYLIIRKTFQSNLPRIHGLGYVDFLLSNLKEFQGRYSDSLVPIENQLQKIQTELESLQPFLEDVAEGHHNKLKILQDCATQLISKAYEVEYVVDACISISKEVPHWCFQPWLLDIIQEITRIKSEVAEIQDNKMPPVPDDTMNTADDHNSLHLAETPSTKEEIVGLEDVTKELRDKLIRGCRELDVISIVGMPGLGKTSLAEKLFFDESVVEHFDIRARCCVSQIYRRMNLLLAILHSATGKTPSSSTEGDVADELRKTLHTKRYLILVDDVWGKKAWDDLIGCFKGIEPGSRIILTTRHLEVAKYARLQSDPVNLRMLSIDESWDLLKSKVIGEESCSQALENVGRQIAKKCGGLPLSIVLVAGLLAKMEKKAESWKQVAASLGPHIRDNAKVIVEQSYQELPCYLKPCFLYFGAFLEDRVINISMLTRLWTSEGFIKSCKGKRLEVIAEGYLKNLVGRNVVMVAQRADSDGMIEACRLHDVLLEFCKEKATEENLLLWKLRGHNANPSSSIYSYNQNAQRRLVFSEVDNLEKWSSSCSLAGSVLFRSDTDFFARLSLPKPTFAISCILQNFKFLKVLDLEQNVVIDSFPTELVYLRYIYAETKQKSIPSSLSNLWNLHTLILKSWGQILLPVTVRKMVKLRHLHITHYFTINNAEKLLEDSTKFYDLVTLSQPYFSCVEDVEMMLRKAPNLRELECKFKGVCSFPFPELEFSTQLETLHIIGEVIEFQHRYPVCISASKLKILKMSVFRLGHDHLSNIAQLQNLWVLELLAIEFDDEKWEVSSEEFSQLKVLKLIYCRNLEEWTVSDEAFPNLEHLFLHGCDDLKEIPYCFRDIGSLKYVEVRECDECVEKSARNIKETIVEEYQRSDFKLFITESRLR